MAYQVNNLAIVQDQFQLMALGAQVKDENEARLNDNLSALFKELQKMIVAQSERISVLEQKLATSDINAQTIATAHLEEKNSQNEYITQLKERIDTLETKLQNHKHIKAHDVAVVVGYNTRPGTRAFRIYPDPIYRYDPSYTEGPTFYENNEK